MEALDERKTKILNAIIRTYLDTGEPVGSRTISKMTDLNLSSATIRNEMSDLEELGYILQPHTSAGRIPSDQGYRFYVDNLMKDKDQEISDMKSFVIEHTEKMEKVLKEAVKLLAVNTNYATMISTPAVTGSKLKFIQLSNVDQNNVLATIVLDGNLVKNKMIKVSESLNQETMLKLNILLNSSLNGLTLDQINLGTITRLKEQAGSHSSMISDVLDAVANAIQPDEDLEVYTSGAKNIFRYPELSDSRKAYELISALEDKTELKNFLADKASDPSDSDEIQIYIGSENEMEEMEDCSVVTANYDLGGGLWGTIGIVGPKRMDYGKVVQSMKIIKQQLDDLYPERKNKKLEIAIRQDFFHALKAEKESDD
jgi:heat-inducible transcriptional repressor